MGFREEAPLNKYAGVYMAVVVKKMYPKGNPKMACPGKWKHGL